MCTYICALIYVLNSFFFRYEWLDPSIKKVRLGKTNTVFFPN